MTFDTARYLGKATARAKSDVANKLASMFLHELSRKLSVKIGLSVSDKIYTSDVERTFGHRCAYCARDLEPDRAAVEHLDGMNRYRAGLHIVGNVVVSCKPCNSEKRRDDSLKRLSLAASGWESFLSHDSKKCPVTCKTCDYWRAVWPNEIERNRSLDGSIARIRAFRKNFEKAEAFRAKAVRELPHVIETIYREGQNYAQTVIENALKSAMAQCQF